MIIVASRGTSFTARLIKFFTKYLLTHFALRFNEKDNSLMLHSETGGVQDTTWDKYKDRFKDNVFWEVNIEVAEEALINIKSRIKGKPYDYLALYSLGLIVLLRKIGFKINKNILGNKQRFMCSEVIVALIEECKKLDPTLNLGTLNSEISTIKDIVEFLDRYPHYFKRV